jgi:hypothetical protein
LKGENTVTLREVVTQAKQLVESIASWTTEFIAEFFQIFLLRTSWMDSNVLIIALVLLCYSYIFTLIMGSVPVRYLTDAEFRARRKKEEEETERQRIMEEKCAKFSKAEKKRLDKIKAEQAYEAAEQAAKKNEKLWAEQ